MERTCGRIRKKEAGEGRVRLNRSRASYPSPSVSPLSSVQRRLGFDMLTFSVKKVGGGAQEAGGISSRTCRLFAWSTAGRGWKCRVRPRLGLRAARGGVELGATSGVCAAWFWGSPIYNGTMGMAN